MAVTYPLSLPDTTSIQEIEFAQHAIVGATQSAFTGAQQVQAHQGQWWSVRGALIPKSRDDAEDWGGFFMSLNGAEGTFLFGDPHGATAKGSASTAPGTPLVDGASQTGDQLVMDGAPNNATNYLKRFDWIQLGSGASARLYRLNADVSSNGSGQATFEIWPDLRSSPGTNDPITVANTVGVFRLADGFRYRIGLDHIYTQEFSAVEAI